MENPTSVPDQGPPSLQAWQDLLAGGTPQVPGLEPILAGLERDRRLEHAWLLLKQARLDPARWGGLQARLKALVDRARTRRMHLWQTDPQRRTLRLRFAALAPVSALHPAGLLALLARTLLAAGLPVAMGLEKSPRPAVRLGHPLPPGVPGGSEWADVVLLEGPGSPVAELPARINACAPAGLRLLECVPVPNHASPVAELCRCAHWSWTCPAADLPAARERLAAFLASDRFEIDKPGKVDGQKGARRLDLRPLLEDPEWDGGRFGFRTRIAPGEAANPCKFLAAILGVAVAGQGPDGFGLARTRVDLAEDPRLLRGAAFEPKLHNMYEDATVLDAGGRIRIVDDDDDEPIRLG